MSAGASTRFFWSDWLGDQAVRRLTPAERGLWIDLLAIAAAASPVGYVCDSSGTPLTDAEIGRVANCPANEVGNLIAAIIEKGAASRDRTGRLYNRRMVRDAALRVKRSEAGKLGGLAKSRNTLSNPVLLGTLLQQNGTRAFPKESISPSSVTSQSAPPPRQEASGVASEGHPLQASPELVANLQHAAKRGYR